MIKSCLYPHITIEEMYSLTEQESDMLLYICNITDPIRPPMPSESNPHPMTLNLIRYVDKRSIVEKIKNAESLIKDEGKEIYNRLKTKLGVES